MNSWVLKESNPNLKKDYLPNNLIKNCKNELIGFVHVEAHDSAIPTIKEVEWLENEMKNHKLSYKHIAFVDLTSSTVDFKKIIDQLVSYKSVSGIRHILSYAEKFDYNPNSEDLSKHENIPRNLEHLATNSLIFDCQVYADQLENILPAIVKYNNVTVIDHMLLPAWKSIDDEDCKYWQNAIIEIARHKNIYLKLSGLDMFQQDFDFAVKFCLENFPLERLMYGSNYPVSCNNDYNIWANYLDKLDLSKEIKEHLFYKNAQKIFNFS